MRFALLIASLAACGGYWEAPELDTPKPLGAGLTASYRVTQQYCDPPPDVDCGNLFDPSTIAAEVTSGPARIDSVDVSGAAFDVTGTGVGTAIIQLSGNDDVTTFVSIDVVAVTTTLVVDRRADASVIVSDIASPAHAFVGSVVRVAQHSETPDRSEVVGEAVLALDRGGTHATFADDLVTTGDVAGSARVVVPSPNDAFLELDVVGIDAITDLSFAERGATLAMIAGTPGLDLVVQPTDAAGDVIAGLGAEGPQLSIADATVATVAAKDNRVARSFVLLPVSAGSTTLDITWGNVHKTFPITVTR